MEKAQKLVTMRAFRSTLTKKCYLIILCMLPFILFFMLYGIKYWRILPIIALIPVAIGIILLSLLILFVFSCLGQTVTMENQAITHKKGSKITVIHYGDLRNVFSRRHLLYRELRIDDGNHSFTILDVAFSQFNEIEQAVRSIKAYKTSHPPEFKL